VANPNAEPLDVRVTFMDTASGEVTELKTVPVYTDPDATWTPFYAGKMGGPVEVKACVQNGSWDNVADRRNVIASQRVLWNGQFNETLGTAPD
jgi:hypothetical protein